MVVIDIDFIKDSFQLFHCQELLSIYGGHHEFAITYSSIAVLISHINKGFNFCFVEISTEICSVTLKQLLFSQNSIA